MECTAEFTRYLEHLGEKLGRSDRQLALNDYCTALMLPLSRKSIEPLAAAIDPFHVRAMHQSLHHFVAASPWSDEAVLGAVQTWVLPKMSFKAGATTFLIADDTGMPKQGVHSVGVARQYCGQLGKTESCQVAVSLSIATPQASLPIKYRLYLPQCWIDDPQRCADAGVPEGIAFASKPQISLDQIAQAKQAGLPGEVVVADAGYGDHTHYRDGITAVGLLYVVGIKPATTVWAPSSAPLPAKPWSGKGRKATRLRRDDTHSPVSVKALALALPQTAWRSITWREGTNAKLSSRFAAVRVRPAHLDTQRDTPRDVEWLLIEWPKGESEPTKYFLSTLPATTTRKALVAAAKVRWRIERDYQELKQEFGLDNFEGRNWRGFHHHATLCIVAYGFLIGQRLSLGQGTKKNSAFRSPPTLSEGHTRRTAGSSSTTRR